MKTITLHDNATTTISNMRDRVALIGNRYGDTSPEYAKAAGSLAAALTALSLSGFGNAEVSRDGDLSLYVAENGFVYGLIFHPDPTPARRKLTEHGIDPDVATDALAHYDVCGSWSMHS